MDLLKGKSVGSRAALQLPSYCRRPDGWAAICFLSLFLAGVLVGTLNVGSRHTVQRCGSSSRFCGG